MEAEGFLQPGKAIVAHSKDATTTFLAGTGCIGKCASHRELIAFAGVDPSVYQSDKFEGGKQDIEAGQPVSEKGDLADDGECCPAERHVQGIRYEKKGRRAGIQAGDLCSGT